jgi:hypothetical protein
VIAGSLFTCDGGTKTRVGLLGVLVVDKGVAG